MIERITQSLSSKKIQFLLKIFAGSWAVICIIMFMFVPGRLSSVHGVLLDNIIFLPSKLANFDFIKFAADLLFSFFKISIIFIAYTVTGLRLIPPIRQHASLQVPKDWGTFVISASSAFLMGHLLFSAIFFTLAYFKHLTPVTITITLSIGVLVNLPNGYKQLMFPIRALKSRVLETFRTGWQTLNTLSAVMLLATLLLSTSRLSYDSVYLYFSDPKGTAIASELHFFHWNYFTISSFQTSIHFAALISLFGDQTARMFSWISGCLTIVFSLGIASKVGLSDKARSILIAMILSTTAITDLMGDGKVDLTSAAIVLAAIYWTLNENGKHEIFVAGIFTGLAISSRPYNLFLLGLFIAFSYIISAYRDKKNPKVLKNLIESALLIGAGAAIPMTLNLFANWAVFGSPLAMFSVVESLQAGKWYSFDPNFIWVMRLLLPFVVTFMNTPQSLGGLTPIFLGFMSILFIGDLRKKINLSQSLGDLLIAAILTLALWIFLFFTVMEIRYVFFLWILLYMPVSEAVAFVSENKSFPLQKLLILLIGILMAFNIARVVFISLETYSPLDAQGNPQCHDFLFCDYLKSINDDAPQEVRVLTLNAYRYYLRTDLLTCSTVGDEYQALRNASLQSANAFWEEVYRQGYTYIAYEHEYAFRHLHIDFIPKPENAPLWMQVIPIYGTPGDPVVAYRISATDPPVSREKECKPNLDNVFEVRPVP